MEVYPCTGHDYCAPLDEQQEFFQSNQVSFVTSDSYIDSGDPNNPIKYYPYDKYYRSLTLDSVYETNFFIRQVSIDQDYLF